MLAARSKIPIAVDPDPTHIAAEIDALLLSEAGLEVRWNHGLEFAAPFPTEREMAKRVETLILHVSARTELIV